MYYMSVCDEFNFYKLDGIDLYIVFSLYYDNTYCECDDDECECECECDENREGECYTTTLSGIMSIANTCGSGWPSIQIFKDDKLICYSRIFHDFTEYIDKYRYPQDEKGRENIREMEKDYNKKREQWWNENVPRINNYPSLKYHEIQTILGKNKLKTGKLPVELIGKIMSYFDEDDL